jgi:tetratricopeptide (TPR) repeat protein
LNSSDFTFLLNQPDAVNERQTNALEKIITEFPYFQSARALRLKGLYSQNSFQYNYALKVTAAYTTDRSVLFDFITSDTFTTIQKGLYDQKVAELNGIEVKGSEIVAEDDAPAVDKLEQSILTSIRESGSDDREQANRNAEEETAVIEDFHDEGNSASESAERIRETQPDEIASAENELNPYFIPEFIPIEESKQTEVKETAEEITTEATEISPQVPAANETEEGKTFDHIEMETAPDFGRTKEIHEETPETGVVEQAAEIQTPEEKLHIGEPLAFSKTETHSFQEWLQLSRIQPIVRDENITETPIIEENTYEELPADDDPEKAKKNQLIDRFIENNPKIPQIKQDVKPAVIAQPKEDHSALMTETLARVYLEQKKYQKAIQAYEILILKYPEKSTFFADRISEIKNLQHNNI